jgi:hypothetical protein
MAWRFTCMDDPARVGKEKATAGATERDRGARRLSSRRRREAVEA